MHHHSPPLRSPFTVPALIARHKYSSLLTIEGELLSLEKDPLRLYLKNHPPPLLIHGPATVKILNLPIEKQPVPWFDILELFLFAFPAQKVTPTARGLALFLHLIDKNDETPLQADILHKITDKIFEKLENDAPTSFGTTLRTRLALLEEAHWSWSDSLKEILYSYEDVKPPSRSQKEASLKIWNSLPQWEDEAPRPQGSHHPLTKEETLSQLRTNLGSLSEIRQEQENFALTIAQTLITRKIPESPNMLLAEAGTGTGKTIGYLTPAHLWAKKNQDTIWISTYTRHLQRQIEEETKKLYLDKKERRRNIVIRKGRENYLCLLNFEDFFEYSRHHAALIALTLLAHWAEKTDDGDLIGGDLPGWFREIFGYSFLNTLTDKRGECIHSACPHYHHCFIEHTIKRAAHADLVIANHALILAQSSWNHHLIHYALPTDFLDDNNAVSHYIFDEGHHIPNAADNAFSLKISGLEAAEMRRWILGAEGQKSRSKGLRKRFETLLSILPALLEPLEQFLSISASTLPTSGWLKRLNDISEREEKLSSPYEHFLHQLDEQRALYCASLPEHKKAHHTSYYEECDLFPIAHALQESAQKLDDAFAEMTNRLQKLIHTLLKELQENDKLDPDIVQSLTAIFKNLHRRILFPLQGWRDILNEILKEPPTDTIKMMPPLFVYFLKREALPTHQEEKEILYDISLNRHWLDPALPFTQTFKNTAQSLLITSATLRDKIAHETEEESWDRAEKEFGAHYFLYPPKKASFQSPFDYSKQARIYIITDITREIIPLARAFQALFEASQGSALGLFTAIARLKEIYELIYQDLEMKNIPLYAQHIDEMDNSTLIDILRTEKRSCLLGTDALRDGVDVPGSALHMVVFERTPWARPNILHRERRRLLSAGEPKLYDDHIARTRLKQAFGRLIRRKSDYGVFVMLDKSTPSRLLSAFPEGVICKKLPLLEAISEIKDFLHHHHNKF